MYISHVLIHHPYTQSITPPRARFLNFCKDLFKLYGNELNPLSLSQGGQYTFAELGGTIFEKCQSLGYLNDLDLLISTNWSPEFDPDYAHWGPYLANRFNLNCDMFDIAEQGIMSSYTALHWLQQLSLTNKVNKAILLGLEQTTIAQAQSDQTVLPSVNGAGVLVLEQTQPAHHCLRVLTTAILTPAKRGANQTELISDWLKTQGVTAQVSWQRQASLLSIFKKLAALMYALPTKDNKFLLAERDVTSQQIGLLLLESLAV